MQRANIFLGGKELLLEQKVPATYLALEDVIGHIAAERRQKKVDPVLDAQDYKTIVSNEMQTRFQRSFRDWAELHQATLFLHDNGTVCNLHLFFGILLFYFLFPRSLLKVCCYTTMMLHLKISIFWILNGCVTC